MMHSKSFPVVHLRWSESFPQLKLVAAYRVPHFAARTSTQTAAERRLSTNGAAAFASSAHLCIVCTLGMLCSPHPQMVSHKYSNLSLWRAVTYNKKTKAFSAAWNGFIILLKGEWVGADVILIIYTEATGESTCLCIQTDVSKFISPCEHTHTHLFFCLGWHLC